MGKKSRDKGAAFDNVIVRWLRDFVNPDFWSVRRGLQAGGGHGIPDVILARVDTPAHPVMSIECKCTAAAPRFVAALEQAEAGATGGSLPIAICKRDWCEPVVVMRLETLKELLGAWQDANGALD